MAIFGLIWVIGLNYCPNSPCYYSGDQQAQPDQHEYWIPFSSGPNTASDFSPDDNKGSAKYYERQDLRAQETMARATNAIVMLTTISLGVSAFGASLLIWTLLETRRTADAARDAVGTTREIGQDQMRAYVHVDAAKVYADREPHPISLSISNTGQTPTTGINIYCEVTVIDARTEQVTISYDRSAVGTNWNAIHNGGQREFQALAGDEHEAIRKVQAGHGPINMVLCGRLRYGTIFGETFESEFCFHTNRIGPGFKQNPSGKGIVEAPSFMSGAPLSLPVYVRLEEKKE